MTVPINSQGNPVGKRSPALSTIMKIVGLGVLMLAVSGCRPSFPATIDPRFPVAADPSLGPGHPMRGRPKAGIFASEVRSLVYTGKTRHVTDMTSRLGEPDEKLSVKEFSALMARAEKAVGHLKYPPVEDTYSFYRDMQECLGGSPTRESWRSCEIWIYRWTMPYVQFYLDCCWLGTTLSVNAESYLFVVRDNQIILGTSISREGWLLGAEEAFRQGRAPFDAEEFTFLLGQPEVEHDVRTLAAQSSAEPSDIVGIALAERAYAAYNETWAAEEGSVPDVEWAENEGFLRCRILLYHWSMPELVVVDLADRSGKIHRRRVAKSYLFLKRDNAIIGGASIDREYEPSEEEKAAESRSFIEEISWQLGWLCFFLFPWAR